MRDDESERRRALPRRAAVRAAPAGAEGTAADTLPPWARRTERLAAILPRRALEQALASSRNG